MLLTKEEFVQQFLLLRPAKNISQFGQINIDIWIKVEIEEAIVRFKAFEEWYREEQIKNLAGVKEDG